MYCVTSNSTFSEEVEKAAEQTSLMQLFSFLFFSHPLYVWPN